MMNKIGVPSATHWLLQRITAVLLIPLTFKLIVLLDHCFNAPYLQTKEWLSSASNLAWIMVWLIAVFYHAALGLQVVLEDYIGNRSLQRLSIKLVNAALLALLLAASLFLFRSV